MWLTAHTSLEYCQVHCQPHQEATLDREDKPEAAARGMDDKISGVIGVVTGAQQSRQVSWVRRDGGGEHCPSFSSHRLGPHLYASTGLRPRRAFHPGLPLICLDFCQNGIVMSRSLKPPFLPAGLGGEYSDSTTGLVRAQHLEDGLGGGHRHCSCCHLRAGQDCHCSAQGEY